MKPFDLERALAGDKVVNGNGQKISEIHLFENEISGNPVCAIIEGHANWYSIKGKSQFLGNIYDLHMDTKIKTFFLNIYRDGEGGILSGAPQDNREKCMILVNHDPYIKTIEIEVEI